MKKKTIAIVLFFTILLNVTACGNSQKDVYDQNTGQTDAEDGIGADDMDTDGKSDAGDGEGENGEQKQEPVKKDLSGELTMKVRNGFIHEKLAKKFMEIYPEVTISITELDRFNFKGTFADMVDFEKSFAVELMSGEAADIVETSAFDYPKVGRNGLLCDLYEYMENDPEFRKEDYFTNIFEASEVDGKLYGVTDGFVPRLAWLNKAVTDALELDMSQYKTITSRQILDLYERAEATGKLPENFWMDKYGVWTLETVESSYRYDGIARTAQYDTPEYVDFLKRLAVLEPPEGGWIAENRMISSEPRFPEDNDYFYYQLNLNGDDFWYVSMENEDWNRPLGHVSDDGRQIFTANPLGISSSSQNKELAWEFLKFCISEHDPADYGKGDQDIWYKDIFSMGIPINRNNCRTLAEHMTAGHVDEEVYDRYIELAESCNFQYFFVLALGVAWEGAVEDYLNKGLITAEDCAKLMQERTETYFKE